MLFNIVAQAADDNGDFAVESAAMSEPSGHGLGPGAEADAGMATGVSVWQGHDSSARTLMAASAGG
jgi:hypothetical protein